MKLLALERIKEKHYSVIGNPETPINEWRRKEVSENEWKELQSENEARLSNTRRCDGNMLLWYGGN